MKKKILVDNGHGRDTPGKRSPDGRFLEYQYNREIARAVVLHLQYRGYDAELLVPEEKDISLKERVKRVNDYCKSLGKDNVCLVSIHVNAAGNGLRWHKATGWCCYTSPGQTEGDKLANAMYAAARYHLEGHLLRTDYRDYDPDLEANFYLLRQTACAAVLTENGFMDCIESLRFLESDQGKAAICNTHVDGILLYVESE